MSSTLSGPTTGVLYSGSTFSVAQSGLFSGIVTPSDNGAGGIFVPEQHQWGNTSTTKTFKYIPNKTGTISISITASSGSVSGSPISLVVSANVATSVVFTGPSVPNTSNGDIAATVGIATANFTVTPNGLLTGTITPRDGGQGGTFTPSSLTFNNSSTAQTFTYTPALTGKIKISLLQPNGFNPNNVFTVNSGPPAATTATLSKVITTVQSGFATIPPFVVSLNGYFQGKITPSDSAGGGTFNPPTLFYPSNSNAPQSFTYTPAQYTSQQTKSISISASPSLSISGSPISLTVTPTTPSSV